MTIRNFSDHAANERTFLAWVRTAIAVIAFGFLVERFDLFLAVMAPAARMAIHRSAFGQMAGLILIAAGAAITVLSVLRFVKTARDIDESRIMPGTGARLDIALAALLVLLVVALLFYLSNAFASA